MTSDTIDVFFAVAIPNLRALTAYEQDLAFGIQV
jgi:hypothetical protein